MYNYKLWLEYDGRKYKGWQKQKYTDNTVQEQIESSIETLLKVKVKLHAAGRTDTGVSAYEQIANFNLPLKLDLQRFRYSMNALLPDSITLKKVLNVNPDFHSRFSAKKREYIYYITFKKKSIGRDYFYKMNGKVDLMKVEQFITFIKRQTFFRSFCKNKEDKNNFTCFIFDFRYRYIKSRDELEFKITANRFLHSMVRAIIGCALEIGTGKIILKNILKKIERGEKISVHYLPSTALFLNKIYY
ncbi:MAG: tRNA pseudouridine(38-40) synthase TruA [Ignavibacteria bacterium]